MDKEIIKFLAQIVAETVRAATQSSNLELLKTLISAAGPVIAAIIVAVGGTFIAHYYTTKRDELERKADTDKHDKEMEVEWRSHAIELAKLDMQRRTTTWEKGNNPMRPSVLDFLANYRDLKELNPSPAKESDLKSPKDLYLTIEKKRITSPNNKSKNETNLNGGSKMNINPEIIGEWQATDGTKFEFQATGYYLVGTLNVPYVLQNSGNTLVINSATTYTRISGDPAHIVGHWRDSSNNEEIYYRGDGRYLSLFDDEPVTYFGRFTATATNLSSYEYRGRFDTTGNQLIFYSFEESPSPNNYSIVQNVLTIKTAQGDNTYTKV